MVKDTWGDAFKMLMGWAFRIYTASVWILLGVLNLWFLWYKQFPLAVLNSPIIIWAMGMLFFIQLENLSEHIPKLFRKIWGRS